MNTLATLNQNQEWQVVGHGAASFAESWGTADWLAFAGTILLALGLVAIVLMALSRNSRYKAVGVVSDQEVEEVKAEIAKAETKTTGEVMVVLLERSDSHPGAHWLAAICLLFNGSILLGAWLPWAHPVWLLGAQGCMAAVGYGLTRCLPDLHNRFISQARAQEMVDEQAIQEFHKLDLRETKGRTGVLLMVSLLEHRVVVLADEGINAKVADGTWDTVQHAIQAQIRTGHMGQGLIEGVRAAGSVLAEHFPGDSTSEDLPNVVIVRHE